MHKPQVKRRDAHVGKTYRFTNEEKRQIKDRLKCGDCGSQLIVYPAILGCSNCMGRLVVPDDVGLGNFECREIARAAPHLASESKLDRKVASL